MKKAIMFVVGIIAAYVVKIAIWPKKSEPSIYEQLKAGKVKPDRIQRFQSWLEKHPRVFKYMRPLREPKVDVPAPEIPTPSLALNQVVPLLIGSTVGEIERELVLQTLARCDGNRTRAARVLGVSVRTLRNKIRLYSADGIDVPAPTE